MLTRLYLTADRKAEIGKVLFTSGVPPIFFTI